MGRADPPVARGTRVVVACLDGRRSRWCVYGFSPLKDALRLVLEGDASHQKFAEVVLKDLKAVFFVKDFRGDSKYKESQKIAEGKPGRKIEVVFSDGEKIVGTTQAYDPKKPGFFLSPPYVTSNSLWVFGVNWNVRSVKFL